jgi:hypothetical protein
MPLAINLDEARAYTGCARACLEHFPAKWLRFAEENAAKGI